jgi:hypothetical protein
VTRGQRAREQFTASMFALIGVAGSWAILGRINVGTVIGCAAASGLNAVMVWKMR